MNEEQTRSHILTALDYIRADIASWQFLAQQANSPGARNFCEEAGTAMQKCHALLHDLLAEDPGLAVFHCIGCGGIFGIDQAIHQVEGQGLCENCYDTQPASLWDRLIDALHRLGWTPEEKVKMEMEIHYEPDEESPAYTADASDWEAH